MKTRHFNELTKSIRELEQMRIFSRFAKTWRQKLIEDYGRLSKVINASEALLELGWANHGLVIPETVISAAALKRQGKDRQADILMSDSLDRGLIQLGIKRMSCREWFEDREELALAALEDYEAERFHACTPVVLLLLDGMGQELMGRPFFVGGRLPALNEYVFDGSGLEIVFKMMCQSVHKKTTEHLHVPLRHGILHGTALNYANKVVAAKAWNMLIAVGEFVIQSEKVIVERIPLPVSTDDRDDHRKELKWSKLSEIEQTAYDAPLEKFVEGLFRLWKAQNFGSLAENCWGLSLKDAGMLRKELGDMQGKLAGFSYERLAASTESVSFKITNEATSLEGELRLGFFDGEVLRPRNSKLGGTWKLYDYRTLVPN